jgi:hypothetical protein
MSCLQTLSSYLLTNLTGGFRAAPLPQIIAASQEPTDPFQKEDE